ncbi:hypothetical protein AOQ84DRAFT_354604 [Glonium stellatum]|uniref:Uncharacterized protein n=1 Tax=Glonium stellatum TaxID=574774 RepID=A0A8E2F0A6_9PEZI|nr:hypothetical protein AOQ84DRAFT_354604 [Glonium stellatum]
MALMMVMVGAEPSKKRNDGGNSNLSRIRKSRNIRKSRYCFKLGEQSGREVGAGGTLATLTMLAVEVLVGMLAEMVAAPVVVLAAKRSLG